MTIHLRMPRALGVVFVMAVSSPMAAPLPAGIIPQDGAFQQVELAREQPSRTETTKAWLKTKKNQTVRWVDRQKNKLRRLAD